MTDYNKYINSSITHYVSNSGSDENGRYTGGLAGDQTGGEWTLKPWAKYWAGWDCVIRHPDERVQRKLAELAIDAALNDHIGYDQANRESYWMQLKACGYDPAKIKINCEADCSAGVIANVKAAGHLLGIPELQRVQASYTGDMATGLKAAGFQILTGTKYRTGSSWLLPGDILLNAAYHTCINVTVGSEMRAKDPAPTRLLGARSGVYFTVTRTKVPSRLRQFVGKCCVDSANVRKWAGTEYGTIIAWPHVNRGNLVDVYDSLLDSKGYTWYYVRISGKFYGFIRADLIMMA